MIKIASHEDIDEISTLRLMQQKDDWGDLYPNKDEELYEVTKKYLEKHLNNDIYLFVEVINNKIVATCGLQVIEYMPQCIGNGIKGYICDVFTLNEYRKKGIQTNLIKNVLEYAKENYITDLSLSSDNSDAIRIYQKFGFKQNELIMKLEIK